MFERLHRQQQRGDAEGDGVREGRQVADLVGHALARGAVDPLLERTGCLPALVSA